MDEQSRVTETANSSDSETRIKKHLCKTNSLKKIFVRDGSLLSLAISVARCVPCLMKRKQKQILLTFNFAEVHYEKFLYQKYQGEQR